MGVTDLWLILEPVKKHTPMTSLFGQVVAVDLSIWIVSSQTVTKMVGTVAKPHLRNLFFRVSHLLQNDILPVFVVDGDAPQVKWSTVAERSRSSQKSRGVAGVAAAAADGRRALLSTKPRRPQLTAAIRECCELLDYIGIPYVRAEGEAEALCAALNQSGLVDAVITDDGDAFLYGATKVYRNFSITKEPSIDSYDMDDIEIILKLCREKLIALALFTGCDYDTRGVPGVGKTQALQLLTAMPGKGVIDRLRQWQSIPLQDLLPYEKSIAAKALGIPEFPNEKVLSEFQAQRCVKKFHRSQFYWKIPQLPRLQVLLKEKLDWPLSYSAGKCIPLLTLWQMTRAAVPRRVTSGPGADELLKPIRIVKKRIKGGEACAEIEWHKPGWLLEEPAANVVLCSTEDAGDDSVELLPNAKTLTTVEKLSLIERYYEELVSEFESMLALKGSSKAGRRKPGASKVDDKVCEPTRITTDVPSQAKESITTQDNDRGMLNDITLRMNSMSIGSTVIPPLIVEGARSLGMDVTGCNLRSDDVQRYLTCGIVPCKSSSHSGVDVSRHVPHGSVPQRTLTSQTLRPPGPAIPSTWTCEQLTSLTPVVLQKPGREASRCHAAKSQSFDSCPFIVTTKPGMYPDHKFKESDVSQDHSVYVVDDEDDDSVVLFDLPDPSSVVLNREQDSVSCHQPVALLLPSVADTRRSLNTLALSTVEPPSPLPLSERLKHRHFPR